MNELIHLLTENVIFLSQAFCQVFLVDDLLRRLIAVKGQSSTRTLHDNGGTEAAKHTRLVVF